MCVDWMAHTKRDHKHQQGAYLCKYSTLLIVFPIEFNIFSGWIQILA